MAAMACGGASTARQAEKSSKQYDLAVGLHQEGNTPGAFKTLFRAIDLDPDNARAHLLLGNLFLINRADNPKSYDERSEKHFLEVLRIENDEEKREHPLSSEARNGLGVLYIHQGKYDAALEVLQLAVDDLFNRQAHTAWGNIGLAHIQNKRYDSAIEALQRSVKLQPAFCVGHYRLGEAYAGQGNSQEAERALTRALEAHPRCDAFQDAWHLRGEARMKLGRREDARADFERCVELQKSTPAGQACARYLEATY